MNFKRIVVDELPESCWECKAIQGIPPKYLYCFDRHIEIDVYTTRPEWCPLEVEEVCEWVREKTDRGYAAFYIPKDHEQHRDCYTQDADTFKFCPSCGKRIKYLESEE